MGNTLAKSDDSKKHEINKTTVLRTTTQPLAYITNTC